MNQLQEMSRRSWRRRGLIALIVIALSVFILPQVYAAFAAVPDGISFAESAQVSTGTPQAPTLTATSTPRATNTLTSTATKTATAMKLNTSTSTPTSTRRASLTPTLTPSRVVTRTPTAVPTLINPFAGMAYVDWRTGDGLLRMDRPVRWQVEPIERAGPSAYIFFQAGAPDVLFQLAVLPVTILQNADSIRQPTNEKLLREFSAQFDARSLTEVEIGGYKGVWASQIVRRESRQTNQEIEFALITSVAMVDSQLFILMQGLVPSVYTTDMNAVMERGRRTLRIDVEGVRAGYARFLPTSTPSRTPTRRPGTSTPAVTVTPNEGAIIRAFVEATYTARANASAVIPTATPPIQATVRAIVAATDTAAEIATSVAATFAAETAMPPDLERTIEAIVGATRTALAGGVIIAPMVVTPSLTPTATPTFAPRATALPSFTPTPASVLPVPGRLARGNPDAKVTFIEFSDFQCPYCGRYHAEVYAKLLAQFGERVRFEYRHFPIESIHPNARRAALASECAAEQGKFWELHDSLYANQERLSRASLIIYAIDAQIGDQARFVRCLDSEQYNNIVNDDYQAGALAGVNGTPTFFILWEGGSEVIIGAQPLAVFVDTLERALAAAR